MKIEVLKSFEKDIAKVNDRELSLNILAIIKSIENCTKPAEITNLKKITGHKHYYRIKLRTYRLGLRIEKDVIILIRLMDRIDIYKYFP